MSFHTVYKNYCTGPFGFPMLEDDARALDKELENEDLSLLRVTKGYDKSNHFIDGERADVSVITSEDVDEDGEVLEIKSMDFGPLRKNPLVTFNHNYLIPPIGRSLWQKQVGNLVRAKTEYTPRPAELHKDIEWFPDSIFHMVKSGFLPGKSIGGVYKRREPTTDELQKYGTSVKKIGYNAKIYEYSVVTRQANNNAIVEAVSKGLMNIPDCMISDLPEVAKILKEFKRKQDELPVIKSFRTSQDAENEFLQKLNELNEKTPEMIEDAFARLLGKV